MELKNKANKDVSFGDMESAFEASAFCTYRALKLSVESLLKNGL
ncbi:hypothetical protein [Flavobacterium zhairuonense]|nr:hypothetical protein [Flavobacterium zhairuonense]